MMQSVTTHQHNTVSMITTSYEGMLLLWQHWRVNSLLLFITYFPVTQSIKFLQLKKCEAPWEPHACWGVFSVRGKVQKKHYWKEKMDKTANTGEIRWQLRVNCSEVMKRRSEGDAYLYSQNVSSFMPWDSTSGWRSSFSFTAHKIKRRYQPFPQEMTASEDHCVPRLLTLSE